jgi:uncharacterized protein (DUF305 family)
VAFLSPTAAAIAQAVEDAAQDTFLKAMRLGKHWGQPAARDIMPPMPWQAYKNMTDEDLKALFAALMAGKPIKNMVPEHQPPAAPPAK